MQELKKRMMNSENIFTTRSTNGTHARTSSLLKNAWKNCKAAKGFLVLTQKEVLSSGQKGENKLQQLPSKERLWSK